MRAIVHQVCRVCGGRTRSKEAMDEHIEHAHGNNWPPAGMVRAKDQMEFHPCLSQTPWGSGLR